MADAAVVAHGSVGGVTGEYTRLTWRKCSLRVRDCARWRGLGCNFFPETLEKIPGKGQLSDVARFRTWVCLSGS